MQEAAQIDNNDSFLDDGLLEGVDLDDGVECWSFMSFEPLGYAIVGIDQINRTPEGLCTHQKRVRELLQEHDPQARVEIDEDVEHGLVIWAKDAFEVTFYLAKKLVAVDEIVKIELG